MRFADLATFIEVCQIASRGSSAGILARVHNARIESPWTAAKGIERERSGHIGRIGKDVGLTKCQAEKRKHALRAVQQRETFLGFECNGCDTRVLECLST